MMNAKTTTVILVAGSVEREFEFSHAENLLRYPSSGWELPKNSPFEFTDNALRNRTNTKVGKRGAKERNLEPCETASEQD